MVSSLWLSICQICIFVLLGLVVVTVMVNGIGIVGYQNSIMFVCTVKLLLLGIKL